MKACFFSPGSTYMHVLYILYEGHGMAWHLHLCDFMCMCIPFVHFCVLSICTGIWCTTTRLFALIWLNANMHSLWCGWFAEVSAMASQNSNNYSAIDINIPLVPMFWSLLLFFLAVLYNPPGAEWRSWCPSNIATFSGGWSTNMVPKDPEVRSDAYLAILRSWCPPSTDDFTHTYDIEELKFWRARRPGDRCWNAWPGNDWPVTSCGFLCWMRPFPSFSFIFHISFLINLPF